MASIYRGYDIEFRNGFYSWRDENDIGHNGYPTEVEAMAAIDKHKKQLRATSAGSPHGE